MGFFSPSLKFWSTSYFYLYQQVLVTLQVSFILEFRTALSGFFLPKTKFYRQATWLSTCAKYCTCRLKIVKDYMLTIYPSNHQWPGFFYVHEHMIRAKGNWEKHRQLKKLTGVNQLNIETRASLGRMLLSYINGSCFLNFFWRSLWW